MNKYKQEQTPESQIVSRILLLAGFGFMSLGDATLDGEAADDRESDTAAADRSTEETRAAAA